MESERRKGFQNSPTFISCFCGVRPSSAAKPVIKSISTGDWHWWVETLECLWTSIFVSEACVFGETRAYHANIGIDLLLLIKTRAWLPLTPLMKHAYRHGIVVTQIDFIDMMWPEDLSTVSSHSTHHRVDRVIILARGMICASSSC